MRREDLIEFATRDRERPARLKADHWAERIRRSGPASGLRTAAGLHAFVRALRPDWPTSEDRDQDLRTHIRVGEMLRSAGGRRAR